MDTDESRPALESGARHLKALELEALALGLAAPAERAAAQRHLGGCAACRELRTSLSASHHEFHAEVLPRSLPRLITSVRTERGRRRAVSWSLGLAMPAVAAFLLLGRAQPPSATGSSLPASERLGPTAVEPDLAVKGGAALMVAARRGARVWQPGPADPVRPADQIRLVVLSATQPFVLIAGVDGAGRITVYQPYGGTHSVSLARGERVELEGSIVLDDSPGPERLFAFFSARPLAASRVRQALEPIAAGGVEVIRQTDRVQVAEASEQASLLLEKAAP